MTVAKWASLATCTFLYQLAHLLMCTHDLPCCHHPLQLALTEVYPLPTRHLLMCTHTHEHVLHTALCGGGGGGIYAVSFPDSTVGMVWERDYFATWCPPSYPIIYRASTIALTRSFYIGSQANGGLEPNSKIDKQYTTINQLTAGRFDPRVFVSCLQPNVL